MWGSAEQIESDLHSGDAERVAEGLDALELALETFEPVAVAMPTADLLDVFGDELSDEIADRFRIVLDRYEGFEPPVSRADRERELSLAAARFKPTRLGLEVSLVLKAADDPAAAVQRALAAVAERGVQPNELVQAGEFVSYLLAGDAVVRGAAVAALAGWQRRPDLAAVVEWVEGELDDDERAALTPPDA